MTTTTEAPEDKEGADPAPAEGVVRTRISDAVFQQARDDYEFGLKGMVQIAEEIGISRQALSKRFKDVGARRGGRAHELAAIEAAKIAAVPPPPERFEDKRADWIEETRMNGFMAMKQAQMIARKIVLDQVKAGGKMGEIDPDLKAAQRYVRTINESFDAQLRLLRSEEYVDDKDLPNIEILDLTDEDVLKHHQSTGAFPLEMTVEEMLAEEIFVGKEDEE